MPSVEFAIDEIEQAAGAQATARIGGVPHHAHGKVRLELAQFFENPTSFLAIALVQIEDQQITQWRPVVRFQHTGHRHCQGKLHGAEKSGTVRLSDSKFTPLRKGGGAVQFEGLAIVKVSFLIEMIVD